MKKYLGIAILFLGTGLWGSQVVKISKNRRDMAVTHDMDSSWEVGQRVCVRNQRGKSFCGRVTKVKSAGAICKMDAPLEGVSTGDEVTVESSLGEESGDLENGASEKKSTKVNKKNSLGFGVRAGLVLGSVSKGDNSEFEKRKALNAGLFLDIPMSTGLLSFEPGLAFVQKGFETDTYGNRLNYLDLSLLLKVRFIQGNFTPLLAIGPYFSYLLSAKYTSSSSEFDVKEQYKSIDFGALASLGFEFKAIDNLRLGLMGAYGLGLADVNAVSGGSSTKHRTLQVLGFFQMGL